MKKTILWTAGVLLLAAAGFAGFVSMQDGTTPKGTTLAGQDVSGLTRAELETRLRNWWREKREATLQPASHLLAKQPQPMALRMLGIEPDFGKTLDGAPIQEYADSLLGKVAKAGPIKVVWRQSGGDFESLKDFVDDNAKSEQPATVKFANGHFSRSYEVPTFILSGFVRQSEP